MLSRLKQSTTTIAKTPPPDTKLAEAAARAQIKTNIHGQNALDLAVINKDVAKVKHLLNTDHGLLMLNMMKHGSKRTPAHWACKKR